MNAPTTKKTIVRKPCRSCGRPVDLDLTEELENAEKAWKEGRPGLTRSQILASEATCAECAEKGEAAPITRRIVTRVLVYEVPGDAEPEQIPTATLERFLDVYETGLGASESDADGEGQATTLLGMFRVEAAATTAGLAIQAVADGLSEQWNKLAASVGLSETEIIETTEEGETDGD